MEVYLGIVILVDKHYHPIQHALMYCDQRAILEAEECQRALVGMIEKIQGLLPASEIYSRTGIQFITINTMN